MRRQFDNNNNVDGEDWKRLCNMGRTKRAWNLTCGWRGDESCKKGTGEMNESDGKQDMNAMQEKVTKRDREQEL